MSKDNQDMYQEHVSKIAEKHKDDLHELNIELGISYFTTSYKIAEYFVRLVILSTFFILWVLLMVVDVEMIDAFKDMTSQEIVKKANFIFSVSVALACLGFMRVLILRGDTFFRDIKSKSHLSDEQNKKMTKLISDISEEAIRRHKFIEKRIDE